VHQFASASSGCDMKESCSKDCASRGRGPHWLQDSELGMSGFIFRSSFFWPPTYAGCKS